MKLKKALYAEQPLEVGAAIKLVSWHRRPTYRYQNGKAMPDYEHAELWITVYKKLD